MHTILLAVLFYISVAFGFLPQAAIAVPVLYGLLLGLNYRPALLVIVCSVQDAPNYSYDTSYIVFVLVVTITVFEVMLYREGRTRLIRFWKLKPNVRKLFLAFLAVAIYGGALSFLQDTYGSRSQSELRDYRLLTVLMLTNYVAAYLCVCLIFRNSKTAFATVAALTCAIVHSLLVAIAQIFAGQEAYRSGDRLEQVLSSGQLTSETAIGIARLNGPFLSPNALGLHVALCLILFVAINEMSKGVSKRDKFFYVSAAISSVVMSMSKALVVHQAIASLILVKSRVNGLLFYFASLILLLLLVTVLYFFPPQDMEVASALAGEVFRIDSSGGLGTRGFAWAAVIDKLTIYDWITGMGLSHWPIFFYTTIGLPLADPHNFLLSILGTLGVVGLVFYVYIIFLMFRSYKSSRYSFILMILVLVLVKDLASIQIVIGNAPATFLIAIAIMLAVSSKGELKEYTNISQAVRRKRTR